MSRGGHGSSVMRGGGLAVLAALLCASTSAFAAAVPVEEGADIPASPETIAIVDEGDKGFAIRHFPSRLRLYTFDRDGSGVSTCVEGCASAWPPVRAPSGARPVGDWTLVPRSDGAAQWAYKGKPVYVRFHDLPDAPAGDGVDGAWRLVPPIPKTMPGARAAR